MAENKSFLWIRYALGEAGGRTAAKIVQKIIGSISASFGDTLLVVGVVGFVQIIAACFAWRFQRFSFFPERKYIIGSLAFGFLAFVSIFLGFTVFQLGGHIGINSFFITLSIVPSALIDRFFFKHHLIFREWIGVCVGVAAGYAILGFPSFAEMVALPLWVWLSIALMFTLAVNQGITKSIQNVDSWVKNFWGGLITLVGVAMSILVTHDSFSGFLLMEALQKLFLPAVFAGALVVLVWSLNLLSYRYGADIAIKKLVVDGVFLISSTLLGVMLFNERFSGFQVIGIALYLISFLLFHNRAWQFIRTRINGHM